MGAGDLQQQAGLGAAAPFANGAPTADHAHAHSHAHTAAQAQLALAQPALNRELAATGTPGTLTAVTATGNQASAVAPSTLKVGAHVGARDVRIKALKERLGYLQGLQSLNLPPALKQRFAGDQAHLTVRLQREVAIDWLVNVAWAAGAPADVIARLDDADIEVVPDGALESDAAYDERRGVILVSQKMVDKLQIEVGELAQRNVIDRVNGLVVDPFALRASDSYHGLVVDQALLAHEATHATQHAHGELNANRAAMQQRVGAMLVAGGDARAAAEAQVVKEYIARFEYETYLEQERYQWQMGAAPRTVAWMTIDNAGQPIAQANAVDNIYRFLTGGGFDGSSVARILDVPAPGAPGRRMPGGELQGFDIPGRRMPGDALQGYDVPGRRMPGTSLQGYEIPGRRMPGDALQGFGMPGRRMPGEVLS